MKMKRMQMLTIVLAVLLTSFFSVNLARGACVDLEKTGPASATPGETITYHFWVKNCGDYDLNTEVYDPLFGPESIWTGTLSPEAVVEFDRVYTLPDPYCGPFDNSALATGWDGCASPRDEATFSVDVICQPPPVCETHLIAGKDWDNPAGVVTVRDDGTNLYVTFETTDGWILEDTHLYVGTEPPTKAAPGRFPFKNQTAYTILLSTLGVECGDDLYIAAHAVVSRDGQEETAWADSYGIPFVKGWAMYFQYEVCNGCIEP